MSTPSGFNAHESEPEMVSHYEIIRRIAEGGMGRVDLARDQRTGDQVAIKQFIESRTVDSEELRKRFQRERHLFDSLDHPNIVRILDHGVHQSSQFLVMEYVEGENLRQRLDGGRLSIEEALEIIRQVTDACQYLHDSGIVHRDLKPENILLDSQDIVRVTDFGLAAPIAELGSMTVTGQVFGSVTYLAPEQRHGLEMDSRADQYSLGVLSYELFTGEAPQMLFEPPSQVDPRLNERVDRVLRKALQKDPDDRFESVREFAEALQQAFQQNVIERRGVLVGATVASSVFLLSAIAFSRRKKAPEKESLSEDATRRDRPPLLDAVKQPVSADDVRASQQDWSDYLNTSVVQDSVTGTELVLIPPGTFMMGATEDDVADQPFVSGMHPAGGANMLPRHAVTLSKPMLVGATEVSVGQFREFVSETAHVTEAELSGEEVSTWDSPGVEERLNKPVGSVSWDDAVAYCNWLSGKEQRPFRLLTEAEWEYVCRAGTHTKWYFGNDFRAWAEAGMPANAFGVRDLVTGVVEWCRDAFLVDYYSQSPATDPLGPSRRSITSRVTRGGSADYETWYSRSAVRRGRPSGYHSPAYGFRVVHPIDRSSDD